MKRAEKYRVHAYYCTPPGLQGYLILPLLLSLSLSHLMTLYIVENVTTQMHSVWCDVIAIVLWLSSSFASILKPIRASLLTYICMLCELSFELVV